MAVLNDESKIKFTGSGDAPIVAGLYSAFYKQVIEHELRSDWFLNAGRAARNFCTLQSFSQVIGGVCVPIGAIMCAPIRMLERYLSNQDSASAFATTVTLLIFAACFLIVLLQVLVSQVLNGYFGELFIQSSELLTSDNMVTSFMRLGLGWQAAILLLWTVCIAGIACLCVPVCLMGIGLARARYLKVSFHQDRYSELRGDIEC